MTSPSSARQYLQQALATGQVQALVTQNPDGTLSIVMDIGPGMGKLVSEPFVGAEGNAGQAQFPLIPMPDILDTPDDLPGAPPLTNSAADIGKFWIIVQSGQGESPLSVGAYIWYGTEFRFLPFGSQGIPGKYGVMKPLVAILGPQQQNGLDVLNEDDDGVGTTDNPYQVELQLAVPKGPPGRSCPLTDMYDTAIPARPAIDSLLTYTGETISVDDDVLPIWTPASIDDNPTGPFSVPQSAFISRIGLFFPGGPEPTVCAFTIPPQPWPYKPCVFGQVRMWELTLTLNIENILATGIEVLLNSPTTGQVIARGFGNTISGVVRFQPHTSTPSLPTRQMTPGNAIGLIDANQVATIYVNIVNEGGLLSIYDFIPTDAQLFVLCVPATLGS